MELQTLRFFLMVAQEESVKKAAKLLNLTSAHLSYQIKNLEDELEAKLFFRSDRMFLTPEGELLRKRAQEIIELADKGLLEYPFFFANEKAWNLLINRDLGD
ncbi:MAG: LysR family transcriptional regulator [Deltaproteobacteria bacterium]|jgi:DNA-binding transcriptional LysR family regulator|nr:LysR family transcriptional regulator [Deltaproteobacteria bacterium]